MATESLTDSDLVRQARDGDGEAWAIIFTRYRPAAYGLARRLLQDPEQAHDITSEAFLKVWRNLSTLDLTKTLNLPAYISLATRHLCLDILRRQQRARFVPWNNYLHDDILAATARDLNPAAVAEMSEVQRSVWTTLNCLGDGHRTALILREFYGLSCEEIGQHMGGLARTAVKSLLFRARIEFRTKHRARLESERKEAA